MLKPSCVKFGSALHILSRTSVILLACTSLLHWTLLTFAIHFLVMFGWIIEQKMTLNKQNLQWLYCFKMAFYYCFCFYYLENGNMLWRRRFFHFVMTLEELIFILIYTFNSRHHFIMQLIGIIFTVLTFLIGIIILELDNLLNTNQKPSNDVADVEDQRNNLATKNEAIHDKEDGLLGHYSVNSQPKSLSLSEIEMNVNHEEIKMRKGPKNTSFENINNSDPHFLPLCNKRETMCSIQDLLANTSVLSNLYNHDKTKETVQLEKACISSELQEHDVQSNHSINKVGLPVKEVGSLSSSLSSKDHLLSCEHLSKSTSNTTDSFDSKLNLTDNKLLVNSVEEKHTIPNLPLEEVTINKCVKSSISNNEDYENIYDSVPVEVKSEKKSSFCRTLFLPKSLLFLQSINESVTTQLSGSHDYENIPSLNVYRANTGVRHWKTYFDIEDQVHDYSTFKERSMIQDSTLASNIYGNNLVLTEISETRPLSVAEKTSSHYSISLPDLTNLEPTACIEVERVENTTDQCNSDINLHKEEAPDSLEEHPSNYEAIWYEEDDYEAHQTETGTSKLFIGKDGSLQESMCNLYYSRLSELSSKYFIHGMKRNNSLNSIIPGTIERQSVRNFMGPKPQFLFEVNDNDEKMEPHDKNTSLPNKMSTPICKGKKIESKLTQKSPLMKLVSLSQNSLHEHTIKALQAGKRVFYRPRVHVITPKKEPNGIHRKISLKITTEDDQSNYKKIDPNILKKRSQLSPKDKLILSEASNYKKIDPNILKKRSQLSPKDKLILSEASALIHKKGTGVKPMATLNSINTSQVHLNLSNEEKGTTTTTTTRDGSDGPQHSTPEGNRHLPQMSILSTISSVASPEESMKLEMESCFSKRSSSFIGEIAPFKRVSSDKLLQRKCSSRPLKEMSVIEEFESIPSRV